ncbi:hypothetical protein PInf_009798 [Phytophthora infestans]|nr:hypothetical protein PInf_009798 [Phytophthora infestans]
MSSAQGPYEDVYDESGDEETVAGPPEILTDPSRPSLTTTEGIGAVHSMVQCAGVRVRGQSGPDAGTGRIEESSVPRDTSTSVPRAPQDSNPDTFVAFPPGSTDSTEGWLNACRWLQSMAPPEVAASLPGASQQPSQPWNTGNTGNVPPNGGQVTPSPARVRMAIPSYQGYTIQSPMTVGLGADPFLTSDATQRSTPVTVAPSSWVSGPGAASWDAQAPSRGVGVGFPPVVTQASQVSPGVPAQGAPAVSFATVQPNQSPGPVNTSPTTSGFGPTVQPSAAGVGPSGGYGTAVPGYSSANLGGAPWSGPNGSYGSNYASGYSHPAPSTAVVPFGMPTNIRNAIRMIQPFYSDGASVEKAKTFWDSFERATVGLEESIRLSAFRECLKGKTGEDWWTYSRINSFDTLRTRFHNQFICQTPLQLIEKLQNTKRPRGMSAEVWGDMISGLCDDAQCYDEQIRYQYFLTGLRNKQWRAALDGSMIDSIRGAVTQLLFKNMHLPSDNDDEFENTSTIRTENAALERMMNMMQQTQNLLVQQQQQQQQLLERPLAAAYPAPAMNVAAAYSPAAQSVPIPQAQPAATTPTTPFRAFCHGPDLYTQDGQIVCGRCHVLGCNRLNCRRGRATCTNCKAAGHISVECEHPPTNGYRNNPPRNGRKCFLCDEPGHLLSDCPLKASLNTLGTAAPQVSTPVQGQAPRQQ